LKPPIIGDLAVPADTGTFALRGGQHRRLAQHRTEARDENVAHGPPLLCQIGRPLVEAYDLASESIACKLMLDDAA
jgi:hypothetical protein